MVKLMTCTWCYQSGISGGKKREPSGASFAKCCEAKSSEMVDTYDAPGGSETKGMPFKQGPTGK